MAYVWREGPDDALDRYVLLKLSDNADQSGHCYPSLPEICEKTRLSESTVRRAIQHLESDGYLTVVRGRGAGRRSRYQLHKVSKGNLSDGNLSERNLSAGPKKPVTPTEKAVPQKNPPDPLYGRTAKNRQETSLMSALRAD